MPSEKNNTFSYKIGLKMDIVKDCGFDLNYQSVILDFGCGSGRCVQELREHGYNAYGCDISMKNEENVNTDAMLKNETIRAIDMDNYILPFKDETFDLIFSDQVFEHVSNYSETISEISRILKPTGFCLHIFPSRYKLIEPHIFIPFSSVIKSYWWVYFWVLLGIRNEWQDCQTVTERTIRYYTYLIEKTRYLKKKQLEAEFGSHFKNIIFCERTFLKYSGRGKYIFAAVRLFPFIPSLYSTFRSRVILTRFPVRST